MKPEAREIPGARAAAGLMLAAAVAIAAFGAWRVRPGALADPVRWPDARIDVNAAGVAELCLLPGVGPGLAERIVADRDAHGPFAGLDDLVRVHGIGPAILERLRCCAVAVISGIDSDDHSGDCVSGAGDTNGDGLPARGT
jgi:competence ComEA-like helix-hairpin-helix protein